MNRKVKFAIGGAVAVVVIIILIFSFAKPKVSPETSTDSSETYADAEYFDNLSDDIFFDIISEADNDDNFTYVDSGEDIPDDYGIDDPNAEDPPSIDEDPFDVEDFETLFDEFEAGGSSDEF